MPIGCTPSWPARLCLWRRARPNPPANIPYCRCPVCASYASSACKLPSAWRLCWRNWLLPKIPPTPPSIVMLKCFYPYRVSEDKSPPRCSAKPPKQLRNEITTPWAPMRVRLPSPGRAARKPSCSCATAVMNAYATLSIHWSRGSVVRDARSKKIYAQMRARGHSMLVRFAAWPTAGWRSSSPCSATTPSTTLNGEQHDLSSPLAYCIQPLLDRVGSSPPPAWVALAGASPQPASNTSAASLSSAYGVISNTTPQPVPTA